jgi:hypothetical protein
MAKRLTPWFPANVKPVHVGRYEVIRKDVSASYPQRTKLLWDGADWRHTSTSGDPRYEGGHADMSGKNKWRGLASAPKGKA